ncbi:hypothetical protein [Asticcacaulis sp. EMRT-3]|uniref:hypothetical protein n=1 Tax=Asticcacaulis sp. EMRT-3 TaxID=3040349 RepID=UPI0024AF2DF2|nr:hypothetical protein [Asticcacaulis sp. EMRT-3]MDI7774205.1 hypothetical protein [Asticcacaulis sp. EMRT-3]
MAILAKLLMTFGGACLMLLGMVIAPLPGPFGVPVMLIGLIIILRGSTWMKRLFVRLLHKYPRVMRPIRALLRPGAKVVALLWLTSLRIERRVLPKRYRYLYRCRRDLRGILHQRRPRRGLVAVTM